MPARAIVAGLRPGPTQTRWKLLGALIACFILGYLTDAISVWFHVPSAIDLLASIVFMAGACFVRLVVGLSLTTIEDVSRLAELEHESITDPLMGIRNRRYLDRRIHEEFARAKRYGLAFSVLLLDVDHFKRVNDTYGHQVGDRVLIGVGKILSASVRACDMVARFGGEEVCVLATSTPTSGALVLAERLRTRVSDSALVPGSEIGASDDVRVTVSIGVASLGPEHESVEALLKSADRALYEAKRNGRNRVMSVPIG